MSHQRFVWKAVDAAGKSQHGIWSGIERSEVQRCLRNEGYFPVSIRPRKTWKTTVLSVRAKVKWNHFTRRLATLLEAGIPLLQSLEIMTGNEKELTLQQKMWTSIHECVEAGSDLSEALSRLNPCPNSFVLSMVRAGEYTGTLGQVLSEVADELDQEDLYKEKIKKALTYPLLLLMTVVVVLCVLSVWVLPTYEKLFLGLGTELPFLTRVIFAGGKKLPVFLGIGLSLFTGGFLSLRMTCPKHWTKRLEGLLGRLPLIGTAYRLHDLVQFSRILGRILAAGIPLLEALRLTASTLHSSEMIELTNRLVLGVRQGRHMSPMLRESKIFPQEAAAMIAVAEETGQLDRMLHYITQMFRRELGDQLDRLTGMIEPTLILVLAALIGLVAAAVMLPIFDISTQLK